MLPDHWKPWTLGALAALALAAVFALYTRPDFLMQLTNELWSCF